MKFKKQIKRNGEINLPANFLIKLNLVDYDYVDISCIGDSIIIKRAYENFCSICGSVSDLKEYKNKYICKECINDLRGRK